MDAEVPEARARRGRRAERAVALTLLGVLAFNYPLASLLAGREWFGAPALFVYLLVAWGGFIAVLALILERGRRR